MTNKNWKGGFICAVLLAACGVSPSDVEEGRKLCEAVGSELNVVSTGCSERLALCKNGTTISVRP